MPAYHTSVATLLRGARAACQVVHRTVTRAAAAPRDFCSAAVSRRFCPLPHAPAGRCCGSVLVLLVLGVAACVRAATPACSNPPQRIVSFSPALTEMLFAIGAGPRVVGVSDFCAFPPETRTRARLGGTVNPNLELLLSLKPDLVVLQGAMDTVQRFCEIYHITARSFTPDSFAGITNTVQALGELTGLSATARHVRAALAARWDAVCAAHTNRAPVPAFVTIWREPDRIASFTTPGAHSFIIEALQAAGGSNVCADVVGSYPTVALEVILRRRPRVIFDIVPSPLPHADLAGYMRAWRSVRATPAGRAVTIIPITNACALIPGPRLIELAEEFSRALSALSQP